MALSTPQGRRNEDQRIVLGGQSRGWAHSEWPQHQPRAGMRGCRARSQLAPGGKELNSPSFSSTPELHGKPGGKGFKREGQQQILSPGAWEGAGGRLSTLQRCCAMSPPSAGSPSPPSGHVPTRSPLPGCCSPQEPVPAVPSFLGVSLLPWELPFLWWVREAPWEAADFHPQNSLHPQVFFQLLPFEVQRQQLATSERDQHGCCDCCTLQGSSSCH